MVTLDKFFREINIINPTSSLKISLLLIFLAFLFGSLILFIPAQYMLLGLVVLFAMVLFLIKPQYCYYLLIFTIPLPFRLRFLPISFSPNDIFVLITVFSVAFNLIFIDKKVNLRTRIDKWVITVLILFFLAGISSVNPVGILTSFKFLEAVLVFYMTVYFVRTKRLTISDIFKVLAFTALFQASLGVLQSITGGLGADFRSDRGYLGRFGIGSTVVWHGHGTMDHFNDLGYLLTTITLFCLPVYYFVCKKKIVRNCLVGLLLWGIITTYSRGSLMGVFAGFLYFLSRIMKSKVRFTVILISSAIIILAAYLYLSHTSYVQTLNPRNKVWEGIIAAITSSARYLWLGAGLNSYNDVVLNFLPPDQQWFAHNFYLLVVQEMGIIGFIIFFSFLISMFIKSFKGFENGHGLLKVLNLSSGLAIFSIFPASVYDHSYSLTYFKILLFLLLGLTYARDNPTHLRD